MPKPVMLLIRRLWLTCVIASSFVIGDADIDEQCQPASCGNLHDIRYPFRLTNGYNNCLSSPFELACNDNWAVLNLYSGAYYVMDINYERYTVQVVDPGLLKDSCPFRPHYLLTRGNFSVPGSYQVPDVGPNLVSSYVSFLDCLLPVDSPGYVQVSCSSSASYSYIMVGDNVKNLQPSCTMASISLFMVDSPARATEVLPFSLIRPWLKSGFQLSWGKLFCQEKCLPRGGSCYFENDPRWVCYDYCKKQFQSLYCFGGVWKRRFIKAAKIAGWTFLGRMALGMIFLFAFSSYKLSRRMLRKDDAVEDFLHAYQNLMPRRYSYSDIKKMTADFEDKLGEGGFASVFKGELPNGHLVAVKLLNGSKGKGQDFMNEVATIGRIHHINVVQLIGYCSEGSKSALVYDFMPNGSLEKYLFSEKGKNIIISWDRMHEIALGVARAIEYLHQGCNMQILHFDIKPHNILLDENFTPKVSDFGLARFYPRDTRSVGLTAARGTRGYMAPEMFWNTIGGVSYKSDVYSYGMLLLEMAGRRKNLNANADNSSQIYFPYWIYDQLQKGLNVALDDASAYDEKVSKKMIMVAIWCIQLKPIDRPSMSKVVEMLEGEDELLQMPPKPSFCPELKPNDDETDADQDTST